MHLDDMDKLCLSLATEGENHSKFLGYIIATTPMCSNCFCDTGYLRIFSKYFLGDEELEKGLFTTSFEKAILYTTFQAANKIASNFKISTDICMLFHPYNEFMIMGFEEQKETIRIGRAV